MSYYLDRRAAPYAFKPYDRRQARRDIHAAGTISHKLSAQLRRARNSVDR